MPHGANSANALQAGGAREIHAPPSFIIILSDYRMSFSQDSR